jgi:membrane protease YdiL (CAAX protease family)
LSVHGPDAGPNKAPSPLISQRVKYCVQCGAQLAIEIEFCSYCGAKQPLSEVTSMIDAAGGMQTGGIGPLTAQSNQAKQGRERGQITRRAYLVSLIIILATAYSQYLIGNIGPVFGVLLVYGIPIFATILLWGKATIRKSLNHMFAATKLGLGFFGAFTALGMVLNVALLYIILSFDPRAAALLNRPNPVLNVSPEFAWVMVVVSFLIVGPAEEYLFRGVVYGGLLSLFKGHHWLILAFVSSMFFAAVHLYYAIVYGITSLLPFTDIVSFGMAMAITYYLSGGNILIPALLHGAYDAVGFLAIAASSELGLLLRLSMTAVGLLVAAMLLFHRVRHGRAGPSAQSDLSTRT